MFGELRSETVHGTAPDIGARETDGTSHCLEMLILCWRTDLARRGQRALACIIIEDIAPESMRAGQIDVAGQQGLPEEVWR